MRHGVPVSPLGVGVLALLLLAAPARAEEGPPSVLSLRHEDGLGESFVLRSVELRLDGEPLPVPPLPPEGTRGHTLPLVEAPLTPGRHLLDYHFVYSGSAGIFTYVEGYRFHMRGRLVLEVEPGTEVQVRTVAAEKPGWDRIWNERPTFVVEAVPRVAVVEAVVGKVDDEPAAPEVATAPVPEAAPVARRVCKPVTVHFASGSTLLDAEGRAALAQLATCLEPGARVRVVGHSDVRGEAAGNARLGLGRAQTVAGALRALGLSPAQLELDTAGNEQLACFGDEETCHRRNRRVVVEVLPPRSAADAPP